MYIVYTYVYVVISISMVVRLCKILDLILFVCWWIRSLSEPAASSGCHNLSYYVSLLCLLACSTGRYDVVKCDWFLECLVSAHVHYAFKALSPWLSICICMCVVLNCETPYFAYSQLAGVYHSFHHICSIHLMQLPKNSWKVMIR